MMTRKEREDREARKDASPLRTREMPSPLMFSRTTPGDARTSSWRFEHVWPEIASRALRRFLMRACGSQYSVADQSVRESELLLLPIMVCKGLVREAEGEVALFFLTFRLQET